MLVWLSVIKMRKYEFFLMRVIKCECGQQLLLFGKTKCNDCGAHYSEIGERILSSQRTKKKNNPSGPTDTLTLSAHHPTQHNFWDAVLAYRQENL
jgi:hypothetical protein